MLTVCAVWKCTIRSQALLNDSLQRAQTSEDDDRLESEMEKNDGMLLYAVSECLSGNIVHVNEGIVFFVPVDRLILVCSICFVIFCIPFLIVNRDLINLFQKSSTGMPPNYRRSQQWM